MFQESQWTEKSLIYMINTPIQGNRWDCGIFLLMHIYQILKCKEIDTLYAQSSCDTFRNFILYRFSKTDYEKKSYQEIKKPNQNILSNPDMISSMSNDIKKQSKSIQSKSETKSKVIADKPSSANLTVHDKDTNTSTTQGIKDPHIDPNETESVSDF